MLAVDGDPGEVGRCGGGRACAEGTGEGEPCAKGGLGGAEGLEERVGERGHRGGEYTGSGGSAMKYWAGWGEAGLWEELLGIARRFVSVWFGLGRGGRHEDDGAGRELPPCWPAEIMSRWVDDGVDFVRYGEINHRVQELWQGNYKVH